MARDNALYGLIYRHRLIAKQALGAAVRLLPVRSGRWLRNLAEQIAFRAVPEYQGDTLPPIFHYWSSRYVSPRLKRLGAGRPEDLYLVEILRRAEALDGPVRIASFGSGSCALELSLATMLRDRGVAADIECIDFNSSLMQGAEENARALGLSEYMRFTVADCNSHAGDGGRDVIVVNQFLHHVENLEGFCSALKRALAPEGVLLTSDLIGRNGHLPWPAVDAIVQAHWDALSPSQMFDRYFGRQQKQYVGIDHAAYSNEGIRAQDIVGCLLEAFDFRVFVTYGGAIMPFVERRIGFNFDREDPADRAFIDRVAEADDAAIASGEYPASNMFAVLCHRGLARERHHDPVSPEQHVAATRSQLALAGNSTH